MTFEFRTRRLPAIACALLLAAAPAVAQDKVKTPEPAETSAPSAPPEIAVEIPEITAEGSTLDADAIRDILTAGNVAGHAEELARLEADRIVIPQVLVSVTIPDDPDASTQFSYNDVELSNVSGGIAASATIGGLTSTGPQDFTIEFGAMSAADFDIGATLAFYGFVEPGADTGFKTIYRDLSFEGGTFAGDGMTCNIGAASAEEFRARPLETPLTEIMTLASEMEASGEEPPPATIAKFLTVYADMITAFESTPMTFEGINCEGEVEEGPMTFALGSMTVDGFVPGTYPQVTISDIAVAVESGPEAGTFNIGEVVLKSFDFSRQVELLRNAPEDVDESWFEANARSLIPAFEGFSFSGVDFDIPDPENPGARIAANVGAFDVSLANYVNGIPASIQSSASNVIIDLPTDSGAPQIQQLIDAGIDRLDVGFNLALAWDEASETIAVNDITFEGANLATIKLAGTVGNAVAELFSTDTTVASMAGLGVTLKDVRLDLTDAGLSDILLGIAGAEQGVDPASMRPMMAGVAEGMVMSVLGGDEQASSVGAAIAAFVRGNTSLSLTATALDEAGLSLFELMAAQEDPTTLLSKVKIDAVSQ
ncbi:hypothetical protein VE25_09605 [Devosia geojensis]|uniref:AsmA-like C-terminal domain-containing protein n=1 Tax=Devosia geojensis TaxID=443610 RepID=A0A0F5FTZ8_9HYPH|nr:hypothetical protein [Devosia geojensis]KKB12025.1 hypothetical protein VE25_09605 [Devosia geojensis]